MTDKVQKIREEVDKIAKSINPFLPDEDGKNSEYEAGRFAMVTQIMQIIDSLQEEPVSIDFEQELYKAFGQVRDFTLGMRIAEWFYDMGKNSQEHVSEEEPTPKVLEDMFNAKSAAESLGISQEEHDKIVDECIYGKEPVSEDLEEEIAMWMKEHFDRDMSRYSGCYLTTNSLLEYARHFANWQKQQDQSTIELAEDHAMFAGMEKMKEKMMKSAVTGQIENGDDFLRIKCLSSGCDAKDEGKLVKLIIIKEG